MRMNKYLSKMDGGKTICQQYGFCFMSAQLVQLSSKTLQTQSDIYFTSEPCWVLLLPGVILLLAGDGGGAVAIVYVSELCFCLEHSRDNATLVLRPGKLGL